MAHDKFRGQVSLIDVKVPLKLVKKKHGRASWVELSSKKICPMSFAWQLPIVLTRIVQ